MNKKVWKLLAAGAALGIFAALAILWPGYDTYKSERIEHGVWAIQTGEAKRYARVNTEVLELDSVKEVASPAYLVQNQETALMFTGGGQKFFEIDEAQPKDLADDDLVAGHEAPKDTVDVKQFGDAILFLTGSGEIFVSEGGSAHRALDFGAVGDAGFLATAFAVNQRGKVGVYSAATGQVLTYDLVNNKTLKVFENAFLNGTQLDVPGNSEPRESDAQVSFSGDDWILFSAQQQLLLAEGAESPVEINITGDAYVQESSVTKDLLYIADGNGLLIYDMKTAEFWREALVPEPLSTTAPIQIAGTVFAAWVNEQGGYFWSSEEQALSSLDFNGLSLPKDLKIGFQSNGSRAILNEQKSGWVWSVPGGNLVKSSQSWRYDDQPPVVIENAQQQAVTDAKPPVAVDDNFGVRAGKTVRLPVLLNDHDPNQDILMIVKESIAGVDEDFLRVGVSNDGQELVAKISAEARGSTSFNYKISDGSSDSAQQSNAATVTLTVKDDSVNEAPVWCGVNECLADWEDLQTAVGETERLNVLGAFVDPEGDPLFAKEISEENEHGRLLVASDGTVTFQHSGEKENQEASFFVNIEVTDIFGASTVKPLRVEISGERTLEIEPFSVTGVIENEINIDLSPHIRGGSGNVILAAAALIDDGEAKISTNETTLNLQIRGSKPGSYLLEVEVSDNISTARGLIRVELFTPEETEIIVPPITAFLRANEDATIDVLDSVYDPLGATLILQQFTINAEPDAFLEAQLVAHKNIRARGAMLEAEEGFLGTAQYEVTDGSGAAQRNSVGEISFVLLPQADASRPIATNDHVTVKPGTQIDIPVLENDVAPIGSQIQIDPESVKLNSENAGLAFSNNRNIRYLAPETSGKFTIDYEIFRLGHPAQKDAARVYINVVDEAQQSLNVPTIDARVVMGESVNIPLQNKNVAGEVLDMTPRRVTSQPSKGIAYLNAEADGFVYESAAEQAGQDSFKYEFSDQFGVLAEATIKVGMLDSLEDARPVTYSDYLQVQVGAENAISIKPLENDLDPSEAGLALKSVRPNALADTQEHEMLQKQLELVDLEKGFLRLRAGKNLGTYSYIYTVENAYGDTSEGLIVVKVVREPVRSYPSVSDTKLNAETVEQLSSGVDVLQNKVTWNSGDTESLKVDLWRDTDDFRVADNKIFGAQKDTAQVVPFSVTGETYTGEIITSYGFLRVPPINSSSLSLKSAYSFFEVNEDESVEINLFDAVLIPAGQELEFLTDEIKTSGSRANSSCEISRRGILNYSAGKGPVRNDSCVVPVKTTEQAEYTRLFFRFLINPRVKQPELRNGTLTVSPGRVETFDLNKMLRDTAEVNVAIRFATEFSGDTFSVTQDGGSLTVAANDSALQGHKETVKIDLLSHPQVPSAYLKLIVGASPERLPRGATVAHTCINDGTDGSCIIDVVGMSGEVNPFENTPLKLVSVEATSVCEAVSFSVANDSQVRAAWNGNSPGAADCQASFRVEDAQNRVSIGERQGTLILDLQGVPRAPTGAEWVSYDQGSVTLRVSSSAASYPAISGYQITDERGKKYSCDASGICKISGLAQGHENNFEVRSINSIGVSTGARNVTAWAYRVPKTPVGSVSAIPSDDGEGHLVRFNVDNIDPSAAQLFVSAESTNRSKTVDVSQGSASFDFDLGTNSPTQVTIHSRSAHKTPPAHVLDSSGAQNRPLVLTASGIGRPTILDTATTVSLAPAGVTVRGIIENNGADTVRIGYAQGNEQCRPDRQLSGPNFEHFFAGSVGSELTVRVCAEHRVAEQSFGIAVFAENTKIEIPVPEDAIYWVGKQAREFATNQFSWGPIAHQVSEREGFVTRFFTDGAEAAHLEELITPGVIPADIYVSYCLADDTEVCSTPVLLVAEGPAASPVVNFDSLDDEAGFCAANLLDRVEIIDPAGTLFAEVHSDGESSYITVTDSNEYFETITSQSCFNYNDPDPDPDPNPDPDPDIDPDPETGADDDSDQP